MDSNLKCPKCGKNTARCQHNGDISSDLRFIDEYVLTCEDGDCGYTKTEHVDGGISGWNEHFTKCPFCGH